MSNTVAGWKIVENKREIILAEIEYWKKNRLLPAAYCDFLVNLYSEGKSANSAGRPARNAHRRYLWIAAAVVLFSCAVWLWLRLLPWAHSLLVVAIAVALAAIGLSQKREPRVRFVFGCLSSMLFLAAGWLEYPHVSGWVNGAVYLFAAVFAVWLLLGAAVRSKWITGTAWMGLLGMIALWEFHQFPLAGRSYGFQHLIWLVSALAVLAWTKALTSFRNPCASVSGVFAIVSLFMPEAIVYISSVASLLVDIVLFLKLAVGISLFVVYRSKIQAWWTTAAGQVGQGM